MARERPTQETAKEHNLKVVVRPRKPYEDLECDGSSHGLPRLAYRVDEVAEMLGISQKSVRRLIARRLLKPSKALRHLLIPRRQIEEVLKATAR